MPRDFAAGLWRLADPKISLASFASIFLGASAAAAGGPLAWGWLGLTVLGIFCLEVAKNASGELVDYDSGTDLAVADADRSPFSGGKRVLVDGLLSRGETAGIAAVGYALGIVAGLVIVALREPRVLWIGVVGTALAYGYHAAPARLSYRGLGELAVALCYGPLIAAGTWLVLRGALDLPRLLPSLPLGLLIGAFLWINEFPDYAADRQAGKHNLVVRLGRQRAAGGFVVLLAVAFGVTLLLPLAGTPPLALLGLLAALPAAAAARTLLAHPTSTAAIVPAQVKTLLAFLLYAVASGVGVWLG
jgi:1,4-dihydroxy-2-naphthoate octaprenyltransferase